MKYLYLLFPLLLYTLLWTGFVSGQSQKYHEYYSRNTFFFEGLGRAVNFSLNYERRYIPAPKIKLGVQAGIAPDIQRINFPLSFSVFYGPGPHHLEAGGGLVLPFDSELTTHRYIYNRLRLSREEIYTHALLGYRYQPDMGGFFFRASYTPMWGVAYNPLMEPFYRLGKKLQHWVGVGVGYSLKNANVR
ncbi:MAG: hypothetical protein SF052_08215 [Bacteroidia bacterium]|nr:hypothetical protein [Bacteroidia bacterium]